MPEGSSRCPETGLEEINGNLPEADFWPASLKVCFEAYIPGSSSSDSDPKPRATDRYVVQQVDSLTQTVRDESGRELACQTQRAAAAPLSSGRVLKAMAACGAARWMALTTVSNRTSRPGGRRRPAPITTQS